jgi:hypothetical protein
MVERGELPSSLVQHLNCRERLMKTFLTQEMLASKKRVPPLFNLSSSIPVFLPSFISQLYPVYIPSLRRVAFKESWRLPLWKPQAHNASDSIPQSRGILRFYHQMPICDFLRPPVLLSVDPRSILLELSRPDPRKRDHLSSSLTGDDPETLARMIILYAGEYQCSENGLTVSSILNRRAPNVQRGKYELA